MGRSVSPRPPWKAPPGKSGQIAPPPALSRDRSSYGGMSSRSLLNDSVISESALAAIRFEHEAHIERTAHIQQLRREKEIRKRDEQQWNRGTRERNEIEKARLE